MSKTYSEKLKDPRWQRLRLEVMKESRFECSNCGADDKELQIHHAAYKKGADPWEYDASELQCLCADCHKLATRNADFLRDMILYDPHSWTLFLDLVKNGDVCEAANSIGERMCIYAHDNPSYKLWDPRAWLPINKRDPISRGVREALEVNGALGVIP